MPSVRSGLGAGREHDEVGWGEPRKESSGGRYRSVRGTRDQGACREGSASPGRDHVRQPNVYPDGWHGFRGGEGFMSGKDAISVSGLVKTFGRTRAVDGLDLWVQAGEGHGFLGPNGAGKSTTLRVLLGLMRKIGRASWRGRVEISGVAVSFKKKN